MSGIVFFFFSFRYDARGSLFVQRLQNCYNSLRYSKQNVLKFVRNMVQGKRPATQQQSLPSFTNICAAFCATALRQRSRGQSGGVPINTFHYRRYPGQNEGHRGAQAFISAHFSRPRLTREAYLYAPAA